MNSRSLASNIGMPFSGGLQDIDLPSFPIWGDEILASYPFGKERRHTPARAAALSLSLPGRHGQPLKPISSRFSRAIHACEADFPNVEDRLH